MPQPHRTALRLPTLALTLVSCAGSLCARPASGAAQPLNQTSAQPFNQPSNQAAGATVGTEITGRDFAGLQLNMPEQRGPITIRASRAAWWTIDAQPAGTVAGQTVGDTVQRAVLRGDVRVTLGNQNFSAARATVWLEPLTPVVNGAASWQIAVYLDRVGDPAAESGAQQAGDRLLVTARVVGTLSVLADALTSDPVEGDVFVREGEFRLARVLDDLANPAQARSADEIDPTRGTVPVLTPAQMAVMERGARSPIAPGQSRPFEPGSQLADPIFRRKAQASLLTDPGAGASTATLNGQSPMFSKTGIFTLAAGEPSFVPGGSVGLGPDESAVIVKGGVVVQYSERRANRTLQISADRAVVYFAGGRPQDLVTNTADKVLGLYVEGNVIATDGQYTLRAEQVYYDVKNNRATLIDAVFWTYDDRLGLPLYVRAGTIKQLGTAQFEASNVQISTSSFFEPHLAIGAGSVTITRDQPAGQIARNIIAAKGVTGRFEGLPIFYWPGFTGEVDNFPLSEVSITNSSSIGVGVRTRWDLFGMLGIEAPRGYNSEFLLDGFSKRGVGTGFDMAYSTPKATGNWFGYIVPDDRGEDQLSSGAKVQRSGEFRGAIFGQHQMTLDERWTLFAQGAYISDENFIDAYYQSLAVQRLEFTNALNLRYLAGNAAFGALLKHDFNDFTANQYLLQSQGYTVTKYPEANYARIADDLLPGAAPGLLSWSQEYRVGQMAMRFTEPTAAELGYNTAPLSQAAFGLNPGQSLGDRLRAEGFTESGVVRADTRQELSMQLALGPVKIDPFATGRATFYDDKFEAFAASAGQPTETENVRLWGGGGVRVSTSVQRLDEDFNSDMFDIRGVRHIIEPSTTIMLSGTNRDSTTLPVYDQRVEQLAQGTTARAGVANTWQTRRGGPGREHTVDFLKINTDYVYSANNTQRLSPIGQFVDYRPEYSLLGNLGVVDGVWQVTDSAALTGSTVYDLDLNQQARTSAGIKLDHSVDFSSFAELRFINPLNATYLDVGGQLRLTSKYTVAAVATYDTDRNKFQSAGSRVAREFPDVTFGLNVGINNITGDVSIGVDIRPLGQDSRAAMLQRLNRSRIDAGFGEPVEVQSRAGWFGGGGVGATRTTGDTSRPSYSGLP